MRSWIIGNSPDCDVVVNSPIASARHCQLTQLPHGFLLSDLGSSNGTYVNGFRIAASTRLNPGDSITLGRSVSFPWPPELTTSIRIGRLSDNDIVLDDARVSGHHARLIVVDGFRPSIEDIGSSNGTFLNLPDRRVTIPTTITDSDTVYFGTLAVPAARLLAGIKAPEPAVPVPPTPAAFTERRDKPRSTLPKTATLPGHGWLLAWLAQAPVFAVLIVLILGRQAAAANWASAGRGVAATTFALALAAIWLGASLAVAAVAAARSALPVGNRLAILTSICPLACAMLLAVVYWGTGLKGPWLALWVMLTLTSLVGFFLGLAVANPIRDMVFAISVVLICFVGMIALGGWLRPLPEMIPPVQLVAEAMPSRWAFEGLFLLEATQHQARVTAAETDAGPSQDMVEKYFPAGSERMGVAADALALGSMLVGLAALVTFISGFSRPHP